MTLGKKIIGGFGLTLLVLVAVGTLSYWTMTKLIDANGQVARTYEYLLSLEQGFSSLKDAQRSARGYVITGKKDWLKPYEAALLIIPDKMTKVEQASGDKHQLHLKEIRQLIEVTLQEFARFVALRSGDSDKGFLAAVEGVKAGEGQKNMERIRVLIEEIAAKEVSDLTRRKEGAETNASVTQWTIAIATAVAVLLVALGSILLVRSITHTIGEGVGQLTSSSAEILASTTQQASGAQEQAAAVTQTMATVDEVTQTADQAAQRAKAVGESVQKTLEIGKTGRKVVEDSLVAMDAVKEKVEVTAENILTLAEQAQAISDIIATVNDIAEQTNLLALNAAIEASRAGEHGKGFTVVASEVKALADQSKKATGQVRQILGEIQKATNTAVLSTEEVTRGVASAIKVGTQAGDTIKTLADTLAEVTRATTQIVASIGQQATGMSQINQAMKNIDQVAKQNTVATRQAAQAAENLSQLGNQLMALIGK